MIIDSHQHPHPGVPQIMAEHGIGKSVLLPVGEEALARVPEMVRECPDKYIPFFWVNIDDLASSIEDLERAVEEWGCRGIKFQPLLQHFYPNEKRLYPVYEKCAELGLVVLFHTGAVAFPQEFGIPHLTKYAHPMPIDEVAFDFPDLSIIAHLGGNYFYEALVLAEKHENILLDTAYLPFFCKRMLPDVTPAQMIERAAEVLGPERILYACEGLAPSAVMETDLSAQAKRQILGLNAAELFGLGD